MFLIPLSIKKEKIYFDLVCLGPMAHCDNVLEFLCRIKLVLPPTPLSFLVLISNYLAPISLPCLYRG